MRQLIILLIGLLFSFSLLAHEDSSIDRDDFILIEQDEFVTIEELENGDLIVIEEQYPVDSQKKLNVQKKDNTKSLEKSPQNVVIDPQDQKLDQKERISEQPVVRVIGIPISSVDPIESKTNQIETEKKAKANQIETEKKVKTENEEKLEDKSEELKVVTTVYFQK